MLFVYLQIYKGFPCGSTGKESGCNAGDLGSIPRLGRSPGEGKGYPLQYSGLENSMDCIVHGVTKSQTRLSNFHYIFKCQQRFYDSIFGYFLFSSHPPLHFWLEDSGNIHSIVLEGTQRKEYFSTERFHEAHPDPENSVSFIKYFNCQSFFS